MSRWRMRRTRRLQKRYVNLSAGSKLQHSCPGTAFFIKPILTSLITLHMICFVYAVCPEACVKPPGECYKSAGTCVDGKCTYSPKKAGVACSGGTCDGAGHCQVQGWFESSGLALGVPGPRYPALLTHMHLLSPLR